MLSGFSAFRVWGVQGSGFRVYSTEGAFGMMRKAGKSGKSGSKPVRMRAFILEMLHALLVCIAQIGRATGIPSMRGGFSFFHSEASCLVLASAVRAQP